MSQAALSKPIQPLLAPYQSLLAPIDTFLHCRTPQAWLEAARQPQVLAVILNDHMRCELKAAQSAAFLLRRYALDQSSGEALLQWLKPYEDFVYRQLQHGDNQRPLTSAKKNGVANALTAQPDLPYSDDIVDKMMRLIKEELHHFDQVLQIIQQRQLAIGHLPASGYAAGLLRHVRTHEPAALVDKLIIGAYIEARSCERFAALAPYIDSELQQFYVSLLRSEARHYQDYLQLAERLAGQPIAARITQFGEWEAQLIKASDDQLRFHSGVPSAAAIEAATQLSAT
ncbi:tRNA isopentenyl-2-thiomethyl-A-37 hydroxylase MiaE [Idiomarina xiamenensis]|uniref:tRNA-(MS[2]IO[6]A)-hydroxylase n=1 Tax=Idiomarina xiamenensis 10-D-4 TaxID=740709 RepID=K2JK72_9GAMM|nr:tRNA isopentenyl-2-thiomethyl-A-37 hydroxylase MiaE [Idiomarina xiamenensis]EKE83861.1 tRNA-(MS[2]IO[6]A)-hydroxylase [Idiomarina xiamenensis 10-D-4]